MYVAAMAPRRRHLRDYSICQKAAPIRVLLYTNDYYNIPLTPVRTIQDIAFSSLGTGRKVYAKRLTARNAYRSRDWESV